MKLRFAPVTRLFAAAGLACLILAAATGAHAGVVVSTYTYDPHDPPGPDVFRFRSGPFGFTPDAVPPSGVVSTARAVDGRRSRLPSGPNREIEFENVSEDTGFRSSTQVGQTVVANANLSSVLQPAPASGPAVARAMSGLRNLHAIADTSHQHWLYNSQPVEINGVIYEPDYFYIRRGRGASAESAWFETWTASASDSASITLALDGHLGNSPGAGCCVAFPAGTDAYREDHHSVRLSARFALVDLSELLICEDPDECGSVGVGHPLPLNILTAHYNGSGDVPFDFAGEWTFNFNTTAGHRYLLLGELAVEASNGGEIDFFNTMRISDIAVARGVLSVDATGGDVADLFARDPGVVPVPATWWLLLLAAAVAAKSRRRASR